MLELCHIYLSVGSIPLFAPLDIAIPAGQIVTLMGPSGSGKSSLLHAIGGHLPPVFGMKGDIRLNGTSLLPLPAERRQIGIMFQHDTLFPHLSVGENLAFGLCPTIRGKARRAAIEQALEDAGLGGFYPRDPATLSGGQSARAALMRALLARPKALLLDEPFARLDKDLRHTMREFVFAHAKARHIPVLLVTHDSDDARAAKGPCHRLTPL